MSKFLAPFVLLVSLLNYHTTHTSYQRMVDRVSSSVVHITGFKPDYGDGRDYYCSGFVLQKDLVLTAQHCLGERMYVDGVASKVIRSDEYVDLALLIVPTTKPAVAFRDEPVDRFEMLTAIGYAFGWDRLMAMQERVLLIAHRIEDDGPPGLIMQNGFVGGMSGGPIVDQDGFVVGIVQRSNEGVGYGVGTLLIRAFLLGDD